MIEPRPDPLAGSVALLLYHLERCDICREIGLRYCSEIENIAAVVRDDRRQLAS